MDFTTVFTTFNPAEAELIESQLEAAGFEPTLTNEFSTLTLSPAAAAGGGICVQVPADQAEDARALIEDTINKRTESVEESGQDDGSESKKAAE